MNSKRVIALLSIMIGWLFIAAAQILSIPLITIAAVAISSLGLVTYFRREGLVTPINIVVMLSSVITLITLIWMTFYVGEIMPFFSYEINVDKNDFIVLAREQMLFFTCLCGGFVFVRSIRPLPNKFVHNLSFRPPTWLWVLAYVVGLGSVVLLYALVGTSGDMLSTIGDKAARRANHGVLILMIYFMYIGAFFWFLRNNNLSAPRRYLGLIILLIPTLLSGSRGPAFATLIAAVSVDEYTGMKVSLKKLAFFGVVVASFFTLYAIFRGNLSNEVFFSSMFKDVSMQAGYIVALDDNVVDTTSHLSALLAPIKAFMPSSFDILSNVMPANNYFTEAVFPLSSSWTASMGLFGEAHYILPGIMVIPYYFFIGVILTMCQSLKNMPVWVKGLLAGCAYRVVRGGFVTGVSFALYLIVPMLALWLVWFVVKSNSSRVNVRRTHGVV